MADQQDVTNKGLMKFFTIEFLVSVCFAIFIGGMVYQEVKADIQNNEDRLERLEDKQDNNKKETDEKLVKISDQTTAIVVKQGQFEIQIKQIDKNVDDILKEVRSLRNSDNDQ